MSQPNLVISLPLSSVLVGRHSNDTTHNVGFSQAHHSGTSSNRYLERDFVVTCAVLVGLTSHVLVLRRGEWDRSAHLVFVSHISILALLFGVTWQATTASQLPWPSLKAASLVGLALVAYMGALFLSIVFYRTSLHRLKRFPVLGYAAISNLYVSYLSVKRWRLHEDIRALHRRQGDVVRVGPTELSIIDPNAIPDVYGLQSRCVRGPICNLSPRRYLYAFDRNKATHDAQRRVWFRAFSAKAVHQYDNITAKHTTQLRRHLGRRAGSSIDMSEVFRLVSYDIMAEIFYGQDPGCLERLQEAKIMKLILEVKTELAVVSRVPWVVALGWIWPFANGSYKQTCDESDKFVSHALGESTTTGNVKENAGPQFHARAFDYFLKAWSQEPDRRRADRVLRGDSDLFLIAGWDNQANMMATTMFLLTQHPQTLKALIAELETRLQAFETATGHAGSAMDQDTSVPWDKILTDVPVMMSILDETMRLFPSLAQGVQRMTPPEGVQLGSTYIPEDTIIAMPHFSLFRDERSFVDPDNFRPERWTTRPDLVKNAKVFVPFGTGQSPCPGRHLATRMMKHMIADLVLNFDFELAPHTSADKILAGRFEAFNMVFGRVELVFQPRRASPGM